MPTTAMEVLFPPKPDLAASYIETQFQRLQHTTQIEGVHHFDILFPRSWKPLPETDEIAKTGRFRQIIQLRGGDAHVDIAIGPVQRDVNPSDWVKVALIAIKEDVLAEREFSTPAGTLPDILSRKVVDGVTLLRRTVGLREGAAIWLVSARAPEATYAKMAKDLLFMLASFRTPNGAGGPIEELLMFQSKRPVPVAFKYPASWKVLQDVAGGEGELHVRVVTEHNGAKAGTVHVQVWPSGPKEKRTEAEFLNSRIEALKALGIEPRVAPLQIIDAKPPYEGLWLVQLVGTFRGAEMTLTTVLARYRAAWVLIGLIGPGRLSSPEWWAITKKAFEDIQQSIRVG